MKILNARQLKEVDEYTIIHEPIPSIELMERASQAFVQKFGEKYNQQYAIFVMCGPGNNGGDGLAIARILSTLDYHVEVGIVNPTDKASKDFLLNRKRIPKSIKVFNIKEETAIPSINPGSIVIDALFGSGLTRAVTGLFKAVIHHINQLEVIRVSVDFPSGLYMDQPQDLSDDAEGAIIKAHYTITFQVPKLGLLLPENQSFVGEWEIVDIGLDKDFMAQIAEELIFFQRKEAKSLILPRLKHSHKGNFGKILTITGSHGKIGASILTNKACIRTGTGLLTALIPGCGYQIMQTAVPEVMVITDDMSDHISLKTMDLTYDTIGIGPGLGSHADTISAMSNLLEKFHKPVVVDADGLNILSENPSFLKNLPPQSILTPHAREFERLVGSWKNSYDRISIQKKFSADNQVIMIFKGAYSTITTPGGKIYFNSSGNPGMATAGSGDVLTGILTSLIGQGYQPENAAVFGVYLHGVAGDLAVEESAQESLIASDIINHIPNAYRFIKSALS